MAESSDLRPGDLAPDVVLPTEHGEPHRLSRGRPVVLYFYPKDDTPACTEEAVAFSERLGEFEAAGVSVIGVSPDSARKHQRFAAKHALAHRLVSDPGRAIIDAYGVWVEKMMFGRRYMGVERATFLIDADGRIARIWHRVRVAGHVDEVLQAVREMAAIRN